LLRAARTRFAQQGYAAASTREIAADAKMRAGNLRHHFGSKAELFIAVFEDCMGTVANAIASNLSQVDVSSPGSYLLLLDRLAAQAPDIVAFLAISPLERARHPELQRDDSRGRVVLEDVVRGSVRSWVQTGALASDMNPDAVADALIAALFGFFVYVSSVDETVDRQATAGALARLLDGTAWSGDTQVGSGNSNPEQSPTPASRNIDPH
jgi:AcrR family transcriptional regulator